MALKKFNPTTPSQRNLVLVDKSALYKGGPVKKLTAGLSKTGGRKNSGHVTSWQAVAGFSGSGELETIAAPQVQGA